MAATTTTPVLLTPRELAEKLRVTEITLWNWRKAGTGPAFVRLSGERGKSGTGRAGIRYSLEAVNAWLVERSEGGDRG